MTINLVAGMLESSAHLDELASTKRKIEAETIGQSIGWKRFSDGEMYECIDISGGYSLGIMQSAQVLVGLAAELSLKYAFESEHPNTVAPSSHKLHSLYCGLSKEKRTAIESDYSERIKGRKDNPPVGWRKAKQVFQASDNYFVDWRYLSEEGRNVSDAFPIWLREAVCSVLASLDIKITWSNSE